MDEPTKQVPLKIIIKTTYVKIEFKIYTNCKKVYKIKRKINILSSSFPCSYIASQYLSLDNG